MRLIDADALCEQLAEDAEQMDDMVAKMFTYAAINDIKRAPTVDAIPVEWIKRWSKKPMTEKDTKLAEQCEWNILDWLIADWQRGKKNERAIRSKNDMHCN